MPSIQQNQVVRSNMHRCLSCSSRSVPDDFLQKQRRSLDHWSFFWSNAVLWDGLLMGRLKGPRSNRRLLDLLQCRLFFWSQSYCWWTSLDRYNVGWFQWIMIGYCLAKLKVSLIHLTSAFIWIISQLSTESIPRTILPCPIYVLCFALFFSIWKYKYLIDIIYKNARFCNTKFTCNLQLLHIKFTLTK